MLILDKMSEKQMLLESLNDETTADAKPVKKRKLHLKENTKSPT